MTDAPGQRVITAYREAFTRRCFEILAIAYSKLNPASFASMEEPAITGELVKSMNRVVEDPTAPAWMVHFTVLDDPPMDYAARKGRARPRVDIELCRTERGEHPRFQLEAKRLHCAKSTSEYLGPNGLGCFLTGRYGSQDNNVGMLGYVQTETVDDWTRRISARLSADPKTFRITKEGTYCPFIFVPALSKMYRSIHRRRKPLPEVVVYHTLLKFY